MAMAADAMGSESLEGDGQSARAVEGFELDPSFGEISSLGIGYQI